MLTGKDIFAAFRQHDKDAIRHMDASAYGVVADMLNAQFISPLYHALQALEERYREKHSATRVLLSESYAEIDGLLRMHEPSREEAQEREESLRDLQQRIVAFLRSDDEPSPAQQIADMKELITDLVDGLQDCWDNEYSLDELNDLKARAQDLLREEPQL